MNTKNQLKIDLDAVLAGNAAIVGIVAHVLVNDRLFIVGQQNHGAYATWEIGQDDSCNYGEYDFRTLHAAYKNMIERATPPEYIRCPECDADVHVDLGECPECKAVFS